MIITKTEYNAGVRSIKVRCGLVSYFLTNKDKRQTSLIVAGRLTYRVTYLDKDMKEPLYYERFRSL